MVGPTYFSYDLLKVRILNYQLLQKRSKWIKESFNIISPNRNHSVFSFSIVVYIFAKGDPWTISVYQIPRDPIIRKTFSSVVSKTVVAHSFAEPKESLGNQLRGFSRNCYGIRSSRALPNESAERTVRTLASFHNRRRCHYNGGACSERCTIRCTRVPHAIPASRPISLLEYNRSINIYERSEECVRQTPRPPWRFVSMTRVTAPSRIFGAGIPPPLWIKVRLWEMIGDRDRNSLYGSMCVAWRRNSR